MSWKNEFYKEVCDFINEKYKVNAVEVTDVYDQAYTGNGCETCGPDIEYTCDISYRTADIEHETVVTYQGSFSSLIEAIT